MGKLIKAKRTPSQRRDKRAQKCPSKDQEPDVREHFTRAGNWIGWVRSCIAYEVSDQHPAYLLQLFKDWRRLHPAEPLPDGLAQEIERALAAHGPPGKTIRLRVWRELRIRAIEANIAAHEAASKSTAREHLINPPKKRRIGTVTARSLAREEAEKALLAAAIRRGQALGLGEHVDPRTPAERKADQEKAKDFKSGPGKVAAQATLQYIKRRKARKRA